MPARAVVCFFGDVVSRIAPSAGPPGRPARTPSTASPGLRARAPRRAGRLLPARRRCSARGALFGGGDRLRLPRPCRLRRRRGTRRLLALGHPVVVSSAVRDEGTSYHYLAPPGRSRPPRGSLRRSKRSSGVQESRSRPGPPGRPTPSTGRRGTRWRSGGRRVPHCRDGGRRPAGGGRFRGVALGQLLYAGDSLAGESWDHRNWVHAHDAREALFWLAMDAAIGLPAVP